MITNIRGMFSLFLTLGDIIPFNIAIFLGSSTTNMHIEGT